MTERSWSFQVFGTPIAKGSVSSRPVQRADGHMGAATWHPKKVRAGEQSVAQMAMQERPDWVRMHMGKPAVLDVLAFFAPPQTVQTRRRPNRNRPVGYEPRHIVPPDGDKLLRLICDALKGIAFDDDKQVWDQRCRKYYAADGQPPGLKIAISYDDAEVPIHPPGGLL